MHKSSMIVTLLTFGILLCVWAFVTGEGLISPLFLPSPGEVWHTFLTVAFGEGYQGSSLWGHLGISMLRILVAFGVATVLAVPLGLLCGAIPLLRAAIAPIVHFYRPLPPLAYYTLLIIWFGIGEVSKVLLLCLAGFAPIFLACVAAVERLDPAKLTAARTLGATGWKLFIYMILPSALPEIIVGLRTALGFIYTTLVAAEMVAAGSGVGWMVLDASKFLNSDVMVVGIVAMGITGILLEAAFRMLERWWVPWKGKGG
ncbi:ABC transporter permease subunit [Paenibacillus guangzhouensis]|uniref:ABC transporter permease subunit n=1 Tax=Paenibacillus guangzhouensis TaxID=1473112 RepID=UPI001266903C|nr:ABC transporter permease subunit [Paenibacillus guangzhouensis]